MRYGPFLILPFVIGFIACGGHTVLGPSEGNGGGSSTDGGTTSTSTEAATTGGSGGAGGQAGSAQGGGTPMTCDDLIEAYREQVDIALRCDPAIDVPQCTVKVLRSLSCQCDAFVNGAARDAIAKLEAYRAEFVALSCVSSPCDCLPATSAICESTGDGGKCTLQN